MYHMMNTTGWDYGFTVLWALHVLSVILFFTGVLFLVLWAFKRLTPDQMKAWGIGLVVFGAIVCLLTIGARGGPWTGYGFEGFGSARMMQWDDNDEVAENVTGGDMGMSMNAMAAMLEGKTGDDFDKAFIQMMIPHHQGAIDMAEAALERAKHGQIREMATRIIAAQQSEIEQMSQWLQEWGYVR